MQCEKITGVKINIVNNGAGGGAIAFSETMNAKPDGLTIGQLGSGLASDQYTVHKLNILLIHMNILAFIQGWYSFFS